MEMKCERCQMARFTYQLRKPDPESKKIWRVFTCSKCGFNISLEEITDERKLDKVPEPRRKPAK